MGTKNLCKNIKILSQKFTIHLTLANMKLLLTQFI